MALIEQRNRKAGALMTAAERILKVIGNRLAGFKTIEDIHTYMASDLMIAKVRETIDRLLELEDSVKADDLQGRLKTAQQEAVRQLRDRQELIVDGGNVIRLGKHAFNINTQPLELTVVHRDGAPYIHLTSTRYFDPITDPAFLATRDVWDQEVVSENRDVYRAEYLAYRLLQSLESSKKIPDALALPPEGRLDLVQTFMGVRYQEGYTKGVHDLDGARIFQALLATHVALQLARYHPTARACAMVYWHRFCPDETKRLWTAKLNGFSARNKLFPGDPAQHRYIAALRELVEKFAQETGLYPAAAAGEAGEYLFFERIGGDTFVVSREADTLVTEFLRHLENTKSGPALEHARAALREHPASELELTRDWARGFLIERPDAARYLEEVTAVLFCAGDLQRSVVQAGATQTIEDMKGAHPRIEGSRYSFDSLTFQVRLKRFERESVPRFEEYHRLKQELLDRERARLRLDEFKPVVLTSFVRNQLVNRLYLPAIGDNLAKQVGAAGDRKRTDLMGMLLLISPPGYGKTTLMEYIANRLGVVFVKINGPTLSHSVTSLDPEEAPNAAAREEVQKLNLALEMGDNVMIYVDDIQHCNPEFLQKFISLCDAQRKIEGVWRGKPRRYDLRGRKVVVVMAGNPYTESGQKFTIPDMLSNRADTYNLGDIIGGNAGWFEASYLENAVTSNAALAPLANKSQKDIQAFIRMAESGATESGGLEGSYSSREVEEVLAVMTKLVRIRKVVMRVNQEYIHSAAQADAFRTEPPFRLQGSYRNMNRLAEKVVAIMNDDEVDALVLDHYRSESQTLTTGAESNLLKFKELIGAAAPEEAARWEEIKTTFRRNQIAGGAEQSDPVSRVVGQLSAFHAGLDAIRETLANQLSNPAEAPHVVVDLAPLGEALHALRRDFSRGSAGPAAIEDEDPLHPRQAPEGLNGRLEELQTMLDRQRDRLLKTQQSLEERARRGVAFPYLTREILTQEFAFLEQFQKVLGEYPTGKAEDKPTGESS